MNKLLVIICLLISFKVYGSSDLNGSNPLAELFLTNNVAGSILIESEDGQHTYQYNVDAQARFVPASTFKIPNTLIILEEGLLKNQNQPITWDGVERNYAPWNQDQTLKSAFQISCVWCYQRYAAMIGNEKYLRYLKAFNYGNQLTGSNITRFWLDGDLKISLQEQIHFLRKVHSGKLPIKPRHISTLKSIMLSESKSGIKIWSKTGWAGKDGWYVGYLTTEGITWFFANHIVINSEADLAFRKSMTMDAFNRLNIIKL